MQYRPAGNQSFGIRVFGPGKNFLYRILLSNFSFVHNNGPVGNFSLIQIAEMQLGYVLQLMALLREQRCRVW